MKTFQYSLAEEQAKESEYLYSTDFGLGPQLRELEDTYNLFELLRDEFFLVV